MRMKKMCTMYFLFLQLSSTFIVYNLLRAIVFVKGLNDSFPDIGNTTNYDMWS